MAYGTLLVSCRNPDDLTSKLTEAKASWHTTNENAKKVEEIIKKADEDSKKIVDEQKGGGSW